MLIGRNRIIYFIIPYDIVIKYVKKCIRSFYKMLKFVCFLSLHSSARATTMSNTKLKQLINVRMASISSTTTATAIGNNARIYLSFVFFFLEMKWGETICAMWTDWRMNCDAATDARSAISMTTLRRDNISVHNIHNHIYDDKTTAAIKYRKFFLITTIGHDIFSPFIHLFVIFLFDLFVFVAVFDSFSFWRFLSLFISP